MCERCWDEEGNPQLDSPVVRAAVESIKAIYREHGAGGGMHIVTDDWNIYDTDLEFCEAWMKDPSHLGGSLEWECWRRMKALTVEERASALALEDGFWS